MNDKYGYAGESAPAPKPATAFDQFNFMCNELAAARDRVESLSARLLGDRPRPTSSDKIPSTPPGMLNKLRYDAQMALGMIGDINESLAVIEREVA